MPLLPVSTLTICTPRGFSPDASIYLGNLAISTVFGPAEFCGVSLLLNTQPDAGFTTWGILSIGVLPFHSVAGSEPSTGLV